jgi:4-alpha-glucanotransferase
MLRPQSVSAHNLGILIIIDNHPIFVYNQRILNIPRASGILLHPTSLPGKFGIGDLGPKAYDFADFLASTEQTLWQILPLGPTGSGNSPYTCFSALRAILF